MGKIYKLLDCFCCAGGASMGYHRAGFDVVGVDINDQPNYPFKFIKGDVLEILKNKEFTDQFDIIVASPPCQHYTRLKNLCTDVNKWNEKHPDLVGITRELLKATGKPYIIENVEGAPLENPITLYGSQFPNMYTQRPRLFESSFKLNVPDTPKRVCKTPKLGSGFGEDGFITVAGTKPPKGMTRVQTKLYYGFALGGIDWMEIEELTQAIPPAYTQFLGKQAIQYLDNQSSDELNEETIMNYMNNHPEIVMKVFMEMWKGQVC